MFSYSGAFVKFSHPDGIAAKEIEGNLSQNFGQNRSDKIPRTCGWILEGESNQAMVQPLSKDKDELGPGQTLARRSLPIPKLSN